MSKISFVIPFIHEYPAIYHTINNIQTEMKDSEYQWEIIAVENGTVDEHTPHAFTGKRPLYRVIMSQGLLKYDFMPEQCGPRARNHGAFNHATGDYVMSMDAHTNLGKNSVEPLVHVLEDNDNVGGVSGLTSWSHYDYNRLGAYYELFHTKDKMEQLKGGPSLVTHMHGHYMALGHIPRDHEVRDNVFGNKPQSFPVCMGSQAYTMYRLDEFKEIGGYFNGCRFYPHPEGYVPLKYWLTGREIRICPQSYHIHGMYPRRYWVSETERQRKVEQYGGLSPSEHGVRNVLMVAHILGGNWWRRTCKSALEKKHNREMDDLEYSAITEVNEREDEVRWFWNHQQQSLTDFLTEARKHRLLGMEKWFHKLGDDPL